MRVEYELPSDVYRQAPGLSHSESKQLAKSPWHYKALKEPRDPALVKASTPQQAQGTMVHVASLEPIAFDDRYAVGPDVNKNTNVWKAFAADCELRGAEPISQQQRDVAFAMAQRVRELPDMRPLFDGCATEVSLWWRCPKTGVLCKARPDLVKRYPPDAIYPDGFAILADVKTTDDASPEGFAASVANYSYHTQAQWYCEGASIALGVPVLSMVFAVVEREYPYAAASYTLDDQALAIATDINLGLRELYAQCKRTDSWPGYPTSTTDIALPPWYVRNYERKIACQTN